MRMNALGAGVASFAVAAALLAASKDAVTPTAIAATVTADIASNVMTVTALAAGSGPLLLGQPVSGTGLAGAYIAGFLTGTGGLGTYMLAGTTVTDGAAIAVTGAAPPFVRAIGAKPAQVGSQPMYSQSAQIPSAPNAAGKVPPRAGLVLLVPCSRAVSYIEFLNPNTGAITQGPAYTISPAGSRQFSGSVRLPNGNILMAPWGADHFWEYDIYADVMIQRAAHTRTNTAAVPAFSGCALGKDGLVYLGAGGHADKRSCIYNPLTYTLDTTGGPLINLHSSWQTANCGGPVKVMPNGWVLYTSVVGSTGQNWTLYDPVNKVAYTTAVTSANASTTISPDGRYLIFGNNGGSVFLGNIDNLVAAPTTATVAVLAIASAAATSARYVGGHPLPNGKLFMVANCVAQCNLIDLDAWAMTDALDMTTVTGWSGTTSGYYANAASSEMLADGRILLMPGTAVSTFPIITLFSAGGTVSEGIRYSRYYATR